MTIGGATASGTLSTLSGVLSYGATLGISGGSQSTPAFTFGGSVESYTQGLYDSMGQLLGSSSTGATQAPADSEAGRQRAAAINSIADKIDQGNTAGARADADEWLKSNGSDVTVVHLVAHSYLLDQNYEQAERWYARASSLAPDSTDLQAYAELSRTLQKSDEEVLDEGKRKMAGAATRSEGARLLLLLTERNPTDADIYLALADGYAAGNSAVEELGALQEALRYADENQINDVIDRAEVLADKHSDVGLPHNILGRALQKAGRYDEAIQELGTASSIAPENTSYAEDVAGAYIARANEKLDRGDFRSADADLSEAQALSPGATGYTEASGRVALYRGAEHVTLGQWAKALVQLNRAESRAPDDDQFKQQLATLYVRVGSHYRSEGSDVQALTAYEKAYGLQPNSAQAKRNLAELSYSLGTEDLTEGNFDSAVSRLEKAYELYRGNDTYRLDLADAYDRRGAYLLERGEIENALEDFKAGVLLDPTNTSLNQHLTEALNGES